jgi:hypothetical protein
MVSELCNFEVSRTAGILLWADLSSLRNLNFWPKNKCKSQETLNTSIVDNVLSFPTDIYMPSYDQWFKSYEFLNWPSYWNSILDRMERLGWFKVLTIFEMETH